MPDHAHAHAMVTGGQNNHSKSKAYVSINVSWGMRGVMKLPSPRELLFSKKTKP